MNDKKKKTRIAVISVSLILIIILGGLGYYFFISTSYSDFFKTTNKGVTLQAVFYDSNGKEIRGTPQTIVNGVPGLFYMGLKISTSNIGNTPLTNIRIQESHPSQLTSALQSQQALIQNLAVGQSNVLQWDTANICTLDANCGTPTEKCVSVASGGKKCLIDISNLNGEITFGATVLANYTDAYGLNPQTTSALINLPITFGQDEVVFRTDASNEAFGTSGKQIVVDRESDGTMEAYTYATTGTGGAYSSAKFITYTPQGRLVFKYSTLDIGISQLTGLDKDAGQTIAYWRYVLGGTLTTIKTPTEPYKSQNCGGIANVLCQERYSIVVSPPEQTCGNDIKEGTEICDGTDLGGNDCTTIGQGFTGGTLICSSCTAWDTTQCTTDGGGDNPNAGKTVVWRTNVMTCTYTEWIGANKWAGFDVDNNPSTPLIGHGDTSTFQSTTKNTDSYTWFTEMGGTSPCGYSLNQYSDQIYAIDVGATTYDGRFDDDKYYDAGGTAEQLSVTPCCGYTCGTCCEKYSDRTTNC